MSATRFEEPRKLTGDSLNPADEGNPENELAVGDPTNELPVAGEESSQQNEQQRKLAEERKQLEEERRKLEVARKELEDARRNLEERQRLEVERKALEEARSQLEKQKKLVEEQRRKLEEERLTRTSSEPLTPVSERNPEALGFFRQSPHSHRWSPPGVNSSLPVYSKDPSLPSCSSNLQASAPPIEWSGLDGGDKFTLVKKPAAVEFFDDEWEKKKVVSNVLPLNLESEKFAIEPGTAFWHIHFEENKITPPPSLKRGRGPYCGRNPANPQNTSFNNFIVCSIKSALKTTLDAIVERKLPSIFTPIRIQAIQKYGSYYCAPDRAHILSQLMTDLPLQYRIEPMTIRWTYILWNPVGAISVDAIKDWRPLYGSDTVYSSDIDLIRLHTLIDIFEKLQKTEFSRLNRVGKIFYVNLLSALTSKMVTNDNFEEIRRFAHREAIKALSQFEEHYGVSDTFSLSLSSVLQPSAPPLEWSGLDGGDQFTPVKKKPAAVEFFDDGWEKKKVVSSVLPLPSRYPPIQEDIPIEPGTTFWQVSFKRHSRIFVSYSEPFCGRNHSAPENPLFDVFVQCCVKTAFKITLDALFERKLPSIFAPTVSQEIQNHYWLYCSPAGNKMSQLMTHLPPQYRIEPMTIRWIYILFSPVGAISIGAIKDWRLLYPGTDSSGSYSTRGRHALIQLHALIDMFETLQRAEFSRLNQISKIFYVNFLSALTSRTVSNDNFEEIRSLAHREAIKTFSQFEEHYGLHDTLSVSLSSRASS